MSALDLFILTSFVTFINGVTTGILQHGVKILRLIVCLVIFFLATYVIIWLSSIAGWESSIVPDKETLDVWIEEQTKDFKQEIEMQQRELAVYQATEKNKEERRKIEEEQQRLDEKKKELDAREQELNSRNVEIEKTNKNNQTALKQTIFVVVGLTLIIAICYFIVGCIIVDTLAKRGYTLYFETFETLCILLFVLVAVFILWIISRNVYNVI